jgi:tripartite-type tricarboxylate transporter receptor subunit TctC
VSSPQRPILPPQVLEALKSGNKIEAIKLLREGGQLGIAEAKAMLDRLEGKAAAKAKSVKPVKMVAKAHVHQHYDPRRPGLSPGEVPRSGAGFGWLVLLVAGLFIILAVLPGGAFAQAFPSRGITLVSPFPPGGSTDAVARIMAQRMQASLGQTVVVENTGGAGGSIGAGRVARATPDGYTIVIGQWDNYVANGVVYPLNYDLQKDFEPLGLLSINPELLLTRKALPVEDLKGLVAWMKANPGKATLANQQASAQTAGVLFQQLTGTSLLLVPYRGGGPAMQDLLAGNIDLLVIQAAAAMPQVRAGTVKALAILSPARSPVVPGVPSVDEAGVAGLHLPGWFALFAPKGIPREALVRLNAAMVEALADPAVRKRFEDLGLDVASREQQSPEGLAAFHRAEIEKWWPVIRAAGIKAE